MRDTNKISNPFVVGALLMLLAVFLFSLMDTTAKSLIQAGYPPLQVVWARYTSQTVLSLILLAPQLHLLLRTAHPVLQLLRSAFLFAATMFFFLALQTMELATATAVFELAPLIITILAFLVLREKVGPRRWFGVVFGLCGALVIIRPGSDVFDWAALLPIGAATCYASYAISTRFLGSAESPWTSFLYTATIGALVASILVPFYWVTPSPLAAAKMLVMGVLGGCGHYLLIRSLRLAEASYLAPFGYAALIFNTIWGITLFAEYPDFWVYVGSAVIVGAGIYVWYREMQARSNMAEIAPVTPQATVPPDSDQNG